MQGRAIRRQFAALAMLAGLVAATPMARAAIDGNWLTAKKNGIVAISRCDDGRLCGRLVWVEIKPSDDNPEAADGRNPSAELRHRPLCGLPILWGFRADSADHWSGGAIYDPESGNTYSAEMTLQPNGSLSLRGYVLVSLFGRSETWTRFTGPVPRCPTMAPDTAK